MLKNDTVKVVSGMQLDSATVLTLQAVPNVGFDFVQWWDGNTDAHRTFVLQGDVTITAIYAQIATSVVETRHALSLHGDMFTIDMTPFPNGNYILQIGNRVAKIVKQ